MKTRKTFLVLLAVVVMSALAVTFLPQKSPTAEAALTGDLTFKVNLGTVMSITVDTAGIDITDLTIGTADTTGTTTMTVKSNDASGFEVTSLLKDLDDDSLGELCIRDGVVCSLTDTDVFETDQGTNSYWKVTVDTTASSMDEIAVWTSSYESPTLATFSTTAIELGETTGTTPTAGETLVVDYEVYADSTVPEATYEGSVTFTIQPKT